MKNITYILGILIAVVFGITSCSEAFLETPATTITDEAYFSSDAAAETALIGVYSAF